MIITLIHLHAIQPGDIHSNHADMIFENSLPYPSSKIGSYGCHFIWRTNIKMDSSWYQDRTNAMNGHLKWKIEIRIN